MMIVADRATARKAGYRTCLPPLHHCGHWRQAVPEIISRKDAQAAGLKRYFSGRLCTRGHVCERYVCNKKCVICKTAETAKWLSDRPGYLNARVRAWHAANPDYSRQWADNNQDRMRAAELRWRTNNPVKSVHKANRRRAAELRAIPGWCDLEMVESVYSLAVAMTKTTGVKHHVDHIIPLRGETVCGLHVPENLQVIPAAQNLTKGNKF
jgi:hypothetical protein